MLRENSNLQPGLLSTTSGKNALSRITQPLHVWSHIITITGLTGTGWGTKEERWLLVLEGTRWGCTDELPHVGCRYVRFSNIWHRVRADSQEQQMELKFFQISNLQNEYRRFDLPYKQPGSQVSIEISYKIQAFGYAYLVHYTMLFHNQGGYYNSLILQALELLPGRAVICCAAIQMSF